MALSDAFDPSDYMDRRSFAPVYNDEAAELGRFEQERLKSKQRPRFPILHVDEIQIGDDPTWLIEGLMPASGFGIVFGAPKSGKSFLLADALFHVAMGRTWAGREVMQGAVVYITGEGVEGFKRRMIAMRRHYAVEGRGVPFLMVPVAPDLGHASGDDAALIEDVRAYLASIGNPPVRAIAIDTLARTMKGADENAAKDMTTFVDNCERIGAAFGCIVIGVHHAGKDVAKGSRGSNALDGAVDVMWSVEKGEAASTASIHHMKDAEDGASWQFRLAQMVLREGGATSQFVAAAVVEVTTLPGEPQQGATGAPRIQVGARPLQLLKVIRLAIADMGAPVLGTVHIPHDARVISRENLKRYLPLHGYWDADKPTNSNRATFSADLKTLKAKEAIGLNSEYVWFGKGQS